MSTEHVEDPMEVDGEEHSTNGAHTKKLDEGLYNRQLYVMGHQAMMRMATSNVLIVGLRGLGVEIAKNIILAGVKSVTLVDDTTVNIADLTAQFFLTEADIGKPRAQACSGRLAELNSYVPVHVASVDALNKPNFLKRFKVIVLTDTPLSLQLKINEFCHINNIAFIYAEVRGAFSYIFCDFGDSFRIVDTNGEPPASHLIAAITQENPAVVTIVDEQRLQFQDGDLVVFSDVQGMTELNDGRPRKVTVLGPYTFSIDGEDARHYHKYETRGVVTQIKPERILSFRPLREAMCGQNFLVVNSDTSKAARQPVLLCGFVALHRFAERHGRFPARDREGELQEFLSICRELYQGELGRPGAPANGDAPCPLDDAAANGVLRQLAAGAIGELPPVAAVIGGICSQEVLKACSGKFTPIHQWLFFDAAEVVPTPEDLQAVTGGVDVDSEFAPQHTRYDGQIAVIGRSLQRRLGGLRYFVVGAGAIGCEVLKNFAMMGVGCSANDGGALHVTDMDVIEKSNLNRQFLFRERDLERPKADTAVRAIAAMNPSAAATARAYTLRVGPETEEVFGEAFYEGLSGVCTALDNMQARLYVDSRCVYYHVPLLESGTLGTKGNTQVVVPNLTESYASSTDPPERTIPMCTLHHFPNQIEHTIQWARDLFEGLFKQLSENTNAYLADRASSNLFVAQLLKQAGPAAVETLEGIRSCLLTERPLSFDHCIAWARLKFEELFNHNIRQLLFNFPADMVTASGAPFWSGPKRAPTPLTFDPNNDLHMDFVVATANLRAVNFGLKGSHDREYFRHVLATVAVPAFTPKTDMKIPSSDSEATQQHRGDDDVRRVEELLAQLPQPSDLAGYRMTVIEFEKDDDTNGHIDFITAASNLRAANYGIAMADKHTTRGIAGKIIPAMVTTTAVVAGLVCIELLKLTWHKVRPRPIEAFKNGFVNLALPFMGFSEPLKPPRATIREGWSFDLWDRIDVDLGGDVTLQQFLEHVRNTHGLQINILSSGPTVIYSMFLPKNKIAERLARKVSKLIRKLSGKPLPKGQRWLVLEASCADVKDGVNKVLDDVPYFRYKYK